MKQFFGNFGRNEDGAVTVDWVVLTAAVVGLAAGIMGSYYTSTSSVGDKTRDFMMSRAIGE